MSATAGDPMMARIMAAIAVHQRGDDAEARATFAALWAEIGDEGDALHRCTLAHAMADVQPDPTEALHWDQRALNAAKQLTTSRLLSTFPTLSLASFFPSLHLNLAEDQRRLGNAAAASRHLEEARRGLDALPDGGYGALVRRGIDRLGERLATDAG